MQSDFLMHYGIKGMHWGVRRFQEAGSSKRTPAGKKRYAHSDNKSDSVKFNGREFKVHIDYNNYPGEKTTDIQKQIGKDVKKIDLGSSLKQVRNYIKENDSDALKEFDSSDSKIKNPFRYIKPKAIYIPKNQTDSKQFHVLCNYRFDPEHGIAITYENGKPKRVVQQDYVL